MTPEEFRAADTSSSTGSPTTAAASRTSRSPRRSDRARSATPSRRTPPPSPSRSTDVLADLDRVVVPGVTQTQHPGFYGWFPSNASLARPAPRRHRVRGVGRARHHVAVGAGAHRGRAGRHRLAPRLCGLAPEWRGAIQDTPPRRVLVAMLAARERASDGSEHRGGLQSLDAPLVAYTSPQAQLGPQGRPPRGFGADNLRYVDVDPVTTRWTRGPAPGDGRGRRGRSRAGGRRRRGRHDRHDGDGPVPAIVEIAREHGAWVHVDAAMAGSAMLLRRCATSSRGSTTPTASRGTRTSGWARSSTPPAVRPRTSTTSSR